MRASLRSVSAGPVFWFDVERDAVFLWDAQRAPHGKWYVKRNGTGEFVTIHSWEWIDVITACEKVLQADPEWGPVEMARLRGIEFEAALDAEYGSLSK